MHKSRKRKTDSTSITLNTVLQKEIKESSKSEVSRFSALLEEGEVGYMDIN